MFRDQVLELLAAHSDELRAMGVRSLALFGSVARGDDRPDSDVDLLVEVERPAGYFKLLRIAKWLETLLGRNVDLVPRTSLKPALRERVLAEAILAA